MNKRPLYDETRNYFGNHFGKDNIHIIWNDKDIIPYLWSQMSDYIKLFEKNNSKVEPILDWLNVGMNILNILNDPPLFSTYRHIPASTSTKIDGGLKENIKDLEGLLDELAYQHVDEYLYKWPNKALTEFAELFKKIIGYGPAEMLTFYMSDAVIERLTQRKK